MGGTLLVNSHLERLITCVGRKKHTLSKGGIPDIQISTRAQS